MLASRSRPLMLLMFQLSLQASLFYSVPMRVVIKVRIRWATASASTTRTSAASAMNRRSLMESGGFGAWMYSDCGG
jgi:hypothetical protein